jgi:type I restriction enzyme S subunit
MLKDWNEVPLGSVIEIASGQVDPKDAHIRDLISVGPDNLLSGGGIDRKTLRTAGQLGQISGKYAFDEKAILYSKIRPNLNKVGLPDFDGICSADVYPIWVSQPDTMDREFLFYVLTSDAFVADASSRSFRTGLPKINRPDLESITISLPPISEQRHIAKLLRAWNAAIEKVNLLIELRERQYFGLRGRLIDWRSGNHAALRTFLKPVSRPTPKPDEQYRALGIRSHGKGTFSRVVEKPDEVDMDTLYVAKAGDIIVNITFAWEGAVALVPAEHDGGLVSHRFPTFVPIPSKANGRYLRHALRMPRFTYLLGIVSPGGAGRNRVLSKSAFLELEAPLPSVDTQERIAAFLDDAEEAIALATKHRQALDQQKRGLMQKLLTGEWRVNGAAKEAAA